MKFEKGPVGGPGPVGHTGLTLSKEQREKLCSWLTAIDQNSD